MYFQKCRYQKLKKSYNKENKVKNVPINISLCTNDEKISNDNHSSYEYDSIFKKIDLNKNGRLSFEEI